ncbi:MAG: DNA repair protein RecO [Candidatus Yanofskybacteria bacterium]|nr:DNA repair protein RecO [Candidatus Yanofskybacteria bacterium]
MVIGGIASQAPLKKMQAVVLKKIPIREYDELVICYTKDAGKQVYQVKSVLLPTSKQAGHLDILNLVDFSLVTPKSFASGQSKNSHPIITSAYCLEAFPRLKSSLSAMAAAFFLLECFDKLIFEGEPDSKLWNFLISKLHYYDTPLESTRTALVIADSRQELLKILGYDSSMPIEHLANSQFRSLQFARQVIK